MPDSKGMGALPQAILLGLFSAMFVLHNLKKGKKT
jgi:hypothetical protein